MVKIAESLYREGPGLDKYRPSQRTPIPNFFMAGSYTYQVGLMVEYRRHQDCAHFMLSALYGLVSKYLCSWGVAKIG